MSVFLYFLDVSFFVLIFLSFLPMSIQCVLLSQWIMVTSQKMEQSTHFAQPERGDYELSALHGYS
jgi:hypothetical protein